MTTWESEYAKSVKAMRLENLRRLLEANPLLPYAYLEQPVGFSSDWISSHLDDLQTAEAKFKIEYERLVPHNQRVMVLTLLKLYVSGKSVNGIKIKSESDLRKLNSYHFYDLRIYPKGSKNEVVKNVIGKTVKLIGLLSKYNLNPTTQQVREALSACENLYGEPVR